MKKQPIAFDAETSKRADSCIAQGALTNSKRAQSFVEGVYPTHLVSGSGVDIYDTAGNVYVDFVCGLGTNLLGYAHQAITEAAIKALRSGATLSLSSEIEVRLGEKVKEIASFIERIKILKSGSEGCTAAVRIARAYTGRSKILTQGYSGWHDEFISMQPPALGVCGSFPVARLETIDQVSSETAAVIIEPFITDISDERIAFLKALRQKCDLTGTVLIFDETITALRFPGFFASNWCGTRPDLIIFGKALGGGLPISVVGGRKEIMECGEYFVSSTFAGERVSIACALAVIDILVGKLNLNDFWQRCESFQTSFNKIVTGVRMDGYPTRGVLSSDDETTRAIFMQEACKSGLIFGTSWFLAFPHMERADQILSTLKEIDLKIKTTNPKLEGKAPKSPFAQNMRGNK